MRVQGISISGTVLLFWEPLSAFLAFFYYNTFFALFDYFPDSSLAPSNALKDDDPVLSSTCVFSGLP